MFTNNGGKGMSMQEIDNMDLHFFYELLETMNEEIQEEQEVYIDQIW